MVGGFGIFMVIRTLANELVTLCPGIGDAAETSGAGLATFGCLNIWIFLLRKQICLKFRTFFG